MDALAKFISFIIPIAAIIFYRWGVGKKYFPALRLRKWFGRGMEDITQKANVMWVVLFVLALIITTAAPYARFGWPKGFESYIAFAAPSAAGIVVGAAIFFDPNPTFDLAGKAYLISIFFIFLGWLGFVIAEPLGWAVFIWTLIITTASATTALVGIAWRKDYKDEVLEPLLMPLVWLVGLASAALGLVGFFALNLVRKS